MAFLDWFRSSARKALGRNDILAEIAAQSAAGKNVTATVALQVSTVLACARVIAEGIAQPPLKLLRDDGKNKLPARDHSLYHVLASRPNEWQTSFEFREMIGFHAVLAGNFYAYKNIGSLGQVLELVPFDPGTVTVKRATDWTLTYEVKGKDGGVKVFPAEKIWHVKGPSWDGFQGLDAVRQAREAIGLSMSTEEQHAKMHKNGVRSSGTYSVDSVLTLDQFKDLRHWLKTEMAGGENAGAPMVVDRGAKWLQTSMTGVDAQHLETRKYQVEEICRFMRVMPIMVGYSDKAATYASSEQMFLAHVVYTLAPWWERVEQSINANLLTDQDRKDGLFVKFIEEGLLRGSLKDTNDALLGLVNGGLMYANEARSKLDLNPDPDPRSDELRIPANIVGAAPDKPVDDPKE